MQFIVRFLMLMFSVFGFQPIALCESNDMTLDNLVSDIQHILVGDGQLAAVISVGPNVPGGEKLFIMNSTHKQQLNIHGTMQVRWLTPSELIVQHSYETILKSLGNRLIRIDNKGQLLEILSDGQGLTEPDVNDIGQWAALKINLKAGGGEGISLHNLDEKSTLPSFIPFKPDAEINSLSHVVWSPDNNKLAVAVLVKSDRGFLPRVGIISDAISGIQVINDKSALNAKPLFWNQEGLYATNSDGLLRCNTTTGKCELVYRLSTSKYIFSGISMGESYALLLVQDHKRDRFEIRAKEVHKVDLLKIKSEVIMALPDDVFISDMDWIVQGLLDKYEEEENGDIYGRSRDFK